MFWNHAVPEGPIGLIAGQGEFPVLFAKAASSLNKNLVVIGIKGYTDKRVEAFAREAHYLELGALGALIELLKHAKLKKVVLAGSIPKREIYNPQFKPDETAKGFITNTRNKGDDHILKAFQLFLKMKCGVSIIDSRIFLKHVLAPKGVLTRRKPSPSERADLKFGYSIAKGIGKLDIGQTVVVKDGVVLAVEAIEGTDRAILRGGELGNGEAVVVKVSKPRQDLRFDLPCVGLETIETLAKAGIKVLGLESGKTLMLSKDKFIERADSENMTLVGF